MFVGILYILGDEHLLHPINLNIIYLSGCIYLLRLYFELESKGI